MPQPDFASPRHTEATVTFAAVAPEEGNAPVYARVYVGHFEARTSPVADTNPATTGGNLDAVATFVPGTYELVANAPGYGHLRFRLTLSAGQNGTVTLTMPTNYASQARAPWSPATASSTRRSSTIRRRRTGIAQAPSRTSAAAP